MLKIQFVSDISCTWCAIGLHSLQTALNRVGDAVGAEIVFEPFELNPGMPPGGQNLTEHVNQKYGSTPSQFAQSRAMFRARGEEVGFTFNLDEESRIYNTFDAHRLLHWAGLAGRQHALKILLFRAHFTDGRDPGDHNLLVALAAEAGLDPVEARRILDTDLFAAEVRAREREWIDRGVRSVPTIVFNEREAIVGGQSVDAFETLIRKLAGQPATG
ncbi:DsbA family oxidoreductase [Halotalea alkalilenta]|uniref:Disulfide bond formation protein DsbA n=1 Tax=Halotalea alkalilenta TaxID=376489 RepID=A0A172YF54_9GAMM|nr:DsbA family oxidoreductase [Halotalea alkalilenta]ANF57746.1 disulfide bond formation protein DsbA [Halotalea alkalilenta]